MAANERTPYQRGKWNSRHVAGKMMATRRAWANLSKFDAILFVGTTEDDKVDHRYDYEYPPVKVELRQPGKRNPTVIQLTQMTTAELDVFEKFMKHAIDTARPACEGLDQIAREAFENGDDGYERLYRQEPKFVDRGTEVVSRTSDDERDESQHSEGLPSGPEGSDSERDNSDSGDEPSGDRGSSSPASD